MRFIDSHLHLSQYSEQNGILKFAKSSETLLLASSTNRNDSVLTLKFADENASCVVPFVGIHPSEATKKGDTEWLEGAVMKASGVGEIGLDPTYSGIGAGSPQIELFQFQLAIAERHSKPVQVHSRGAETECLELLSSYSPSATLLHWFEGESESSVAADEGFVVSFGPALLYSKKLQRIALSYPADLILSESDGPVTFSPLGGTGGPMLVPSVVFKLAELKRESFQDMTDRLSRNCAAYLQSSEKG